MTAPAHRPLPRLAAAGLTLRRGGRPLFAGLDLAVAAGELLELRGPNGAGKTSLLMVLAGALAPDAGTVTRPGGTMEAPDAAALHLLLPRPGLKARLSVGENLDFWRALNGPTGLAVGPALERVGLGGLAGIEAGHLSTGQLKRLALARLLVSERPVWLLDEPTSALDEAGQALVGALIAAHCAAGGLAVVATHDAIGARIAGGPRVLTLGAPA